MYKFTNHIFQLTIAVLLTAYCSAATAALNTNTALISLKPVCDAVEDTCFDKDSISTMLNWMWVTRQPSSSSPLMVDIAPGVYSMPAQMFCVDSGSVTFRGSGVLNTILTGGKINGSSPAVIDIFNCGALSFQDLTVRSNTRQSGSGSVAAVKWYGAGSSTWSNVSLEGTTHGWFSKECAGSKHDWSSSTINATSSSSPVPLVVVAHFANCGEHNIHGSELSVNNQGETLFSILAVSAGAAATINITGSSIRVYSNTNIVNVFNSSISAIAAAMNSKVYMSGGLISVTADTVENQDVDAFRVGVEGFRGGGYISASGLNYDLHPGGTGLIRRIVIINGSTEETDGVIEAPHTWPAGGAPPNIESINGADTFIDTSGSVPVMYIYHKSCTGGGGTWINTAGVCRPQEQI